MCEKRWTYYDPIVGQQFLGLYHGQDSGHVMVYHNKSVILIDFKVLTDKKYSFIFHNQMYNLSIAKQDDTFTYEFSSSEEESPSHWLYRWKYKLLDSFGFSA